MEITEQHFDPGAASPSRTQLPLFAVPPWEASS